MANKYTTLQELFTAIAGAIRSKKNSANTIVADNFPEEINGLTTDSLNYTNSKVTSIADYAFKNC